MYTNVELLLRFSETVAVKEIMCIYINELVLLVTLGLAANLSLC